MTVRQYVCLASVAVVVGVPAALGFLLRSSGGEEPAAAPIPVRPETGPYRPLQYVLTTEQAIRYYQERADRDPQDAATRTFLAQAYLREAREMGDYDSYGRAEAAVGRALELNPGYLPARGTRVSLLLARHRFAEALRQAEQLRRENPGEPELLFAVGDAHLELGHYADAERAYRDLLREDPNAPLDSRLARLEELKGHTAEALRLMGRAAKEEGGDTVSPRSRSWYEFRLGEIHFNAGHLEEAARHYGACLALHPRYPLALAFLGKVRAAQGRDDEALELYRKAVGGGATLAVYADRGDLAARAGNDFLARLNYEQLEKAAAGQAVFDRELALFYADHDRNLPRAVELAERDLKVRQDVYAHDALAWALCKNGRFAEAAKAMDEALKLGTQDASLFYHAGMIQDGLGDRGRARSYLGRALALNPHFSVLQAARARAALARLGGPDAAGRK